MLNHKLLLDKRLINEIFRRTSLFGRTNPSRWRNKLTLRVPLNGRTDTVVVSLFFIRSQLGKKKPQAVKHPFFNMDLTTVFEYDGENKHTYVNKYFFFLLSIVLVCSVLHDAQQWIIYKN